MGLSILGSLIDKYLFSEKKTTKSRQDVQGPSSRAEEIHGQENPPEDQRQQKCEKSKLKRTQPFLIKLLISGGGNSVRI